MDDKVWFCENSKRWLDFLYHVPETCPYGSWMECDGCDYAVEREPTRYYKRKMMILRSYRTSEAQE